MLFLQLSPFGSNIAAAMNNEGILLCCGRVDMWMYRVGELARLFYNASKSHSY